MRSYNRVNSKSKVSRRRRKTLRQKSGKVGRKETEGREEHKAVQEFWPRWVNGVILAMEERSQPGVAQIDFKLILKTKYKCGGTQMSRRTERRDRQEKISKRKDSERIQTESGRWGAERTAKKG